MYEWVGKGSVTPDWSHLLHNPAPGYFTETVPANNSEKTKRYIRLLITNFLGNAPKYISVLKGQL